jgi:hypothetical protein
MSCGRMIEMITKLIEVDAYRGMEAQYTLDAIREMLGMDEECECEQTETVEQPEKPKALPRLKVDSGFIEEFYYDEAELELVVCMRNGNEYVYSEVPVDLWHDLCAAHEDGESVGAFYNEWIKNVYESERI